MQMCLESTKQKYVLFTAFAEADGPHGMLAMAAAMEKTSQAVFGTERYAYVPAVLETLVGNYIDAGFLTLSKKGVAITDVGLSAVKRLRPYIRKEDLERQAKSGA